MSTQIKVQCPSCDKHLQLTPSAFHLTVFDAGNGHYYEFFCPKCHAAIQKPADASIQTLLTQGGVSSSYVHIPKEMLETHRGAPINKDDLLDFVTSMAACGDIVLEAQVTDGAR